MYQSPDQWLVDSSSATDMVSVAVKLVLPAELEVQAD